MKTSALVSLCLVSVSAFVIDARDSFDAADYGGSDTIVRDVAIIGGGATGIYSAVNLRKAGKSVVVVERDAILGGHSNTYIDPSTKTPINFGTQAFYDIPVARNYFNYLNITTSRYQGVPLNTTYVDFQTGQNVTGVQNTNNFTAYEAQLSKYPYLAYSWNIPSPVPKDLLLPFSEFSTKYNLASGAYSLFEAGEGFANFFSQLTVNVMKLVDGAYFTTIGGQSLVPASGDNGEIYTKAKALLGSNVLLSSTVASAQRTASDGVSLVIKTPSGKKLIKVSKLLVTIPPLQSNMAPFDLDSTESNLFSQWSYTNYFTLLVNNTGLPTGYRYLNANSSTVLYNTPQLPAPYQITGTRIPGLSFVWYGSPTTLTETQVKTDVANVIKRLRTTFKSTVTSDPTFVDFRSHTPFKLVVGAKAIQNGFYKRLDGRHRSTYYTGAAFESHAASILWNFTQAVVLPKVLA